MEGNIVDILPNATFKIQLKESEMIINGYISGKMRQHNIMIMMGDSVQVEISSYDWSKGRIIRRN